MTTEPNVRFWTNTNRFLTKITLRPGQRLHWEANRNYYLGPVLISDHISIDFEYSSNKVWKRESITRCEDGEKYISHWLGSATVNEINVAEDQSNGDLLFDTDELWFDVV